MLNTNLSWIKVNKKWVCKEDNCKSYDANLETNLVLWRTFTKLNFRITK